VSSVRHDLDVAEMSAFSPGTASDSKLFPKPG
jgi:hypothetical protein